MLERPSAPFVWHTADVRSALPPDWTAEIADVVKRHAARHELAPTSVTSREDASVSRLPVVTVDGAPIARELPWLWAMYVSYFREIAQQLWDERVSTASEVRHAINLNVQVGASMRYECHVDSNPIGGLLYATTHSPGSGGELVVANRGDVSGVAAIEADCSRIHPIAGHFVLFDARRHSHYVAPLREPGAMRIVVAMNFYTPSAPESDRPDDLSDHLFTPQNRDKEQQPA